MMSFKGRRFNDITDFKKLWGLLAKIQKYNSQNAFKWWCMHWPCHIMFEGNYFERATLTRRCFFLIFYLFIYLFILFKEMNSVQKVCSCHVY